MVENQEMIMPVAPLYSGGNGNNGSCFGWGSDIWVILLVLFALGGFGGWGMNGFGGGYGNMFEFPWLLNGQQGINANTNAGFYQQSTATALGSLSDAVATGFGDVQLGLCNGFAGVNATVNGAQNAIAQQLYSNQIADMERSYSAQTAASQGFNSLQGQLAQCCCDQRLATCQTQNIVQNEGNATRFADANNTSAIMNAINSGVQSIKDQLCQDKIDEKNDIIAQLRQENLYARGQASQDVQTARLLAGQTSEVDALYNRLSQCPVPCMPVYGMTPIFQCNNGNNGCGCNGGNF